MKMKTLKLSMLAFAALSIGFISCGKKDTPTPEPTPAVTKTDSLRTSFSATAPYTFYSFKNGAVVANSDSATNKWDFGVRFVNIIVNSHASGPGTAGVITQPGIFESFSTAPETGYAYDTTSTKMAINAGFTTGWYNYDPADPTHTFHPKAGQFFVFKTSDNHYVKMEILSVDYADFVSPTAPPKTLIYKFRYTYQPDGSRNF
jgi:hypothetical protein